VGYYERKTPTKKEKIKKFEKKYKKYLTNDWNYGIIYM
jgi:hypothetical protein